jgi:hypothetical protein
MNRQPEVGMAVILRDQSGGSHRGHVRSLTHGHIGIVIDEGREQPFPLKARVLVTWPDDLGLVCLPSMVVQAPTGTNLSWIVQVVGTPWREQRRRYLRAALSGTIRLRPTGTPAAEAVQGHLIDLSEAGLRCAIDERHLDLREATTPVIVSLDLDDDDFELAGKVLYGRPVARQQLELEVVILFDRPVVQLDLLRRHLEQINSAASKSQDSSVADLNERRAQRRGGPIR